MLETERILLRPPTDDDLEDIHRLYCDPDIQKFLGGSSDRAISKRQLEQAILSFKKNGYGVLMIFQKEEGYLWDSVKFNLHPYPTRKTLKSYMAFCQNGEAKDTLNTISPPKIADGLPNNDDL